MIHSLVDTHVHYDDAVFNMDRDVVLNEQFSGGVEIIINSGFNVESSRKAVELAGLYPNIYTSVGVFPLESHKTGENWLDEIEIMAKSQKCVAIGEIGLDYHTGDDLAPTLEQRKSQRGVFVAQLKLAQKLDLPVVIHNRDADEDMITILKEHNAKGVIHRFFSIEKYGALLLEAGMSLAIGPAITYPNAKRILPIVKNMPIERLLIETDGPFLPISSKPGQRGVSTMLKEVCEVIAAVRGDISAQDVAKVSCENAKRLFVFDQKQ